MSHFMELLIALTNVGAHGPTFCSALQIRAWYELLDGDVQLL